MKPLTVVMHLVLGADNVAYETGPMTFDDVVDAVRCGQYRDVRHVLALTFKDGEGIASDVTEKVARKIYAQSPDHPIAYGGDAYIFVERELSFEHAERCAWEDARERKSERRRDMAMEMAQ